MKNQCKQKKYSPLFDEQFERDNLLLLAVLNKFTKKKNEINIKKILRIFFAIQNIDELATQHVSGQIDKFGLWILNKTSNGK